VKLSVAQLQKGQKGIIQDFNIDLIPLKLLEMGCLPGNEVQLLQVAPFGDPLYLTINDCHVAIRLETASVIHVEIAKESEL
jgi:ferrous iron transport protein A